MSPGQLGHTGQGGDKIIQRPGYDDAVVDVQPEHDSHGGVPDTLQTVERVEFLSYSSHLEHWHQLTDKGAASSAQILSCGHLLEEDRDATGKHGDEVDEQKGSWCNIFYAREELFFEFTIRLPPPFL